MFQLSETVKAVALSPWPFGAIGVVTLAVGLILVIRPRQAGKKFWKFQQGMQPYWNVPKWPVGVTIAAGCLFLLIAVAMTYAAWALLQK